MATTARTAAATATVAARPVAAAAAAARKRARFRTGVRPRIKPPIQEIFRRGDEVLVQVIKEGIGTKGPTLSTYISIPGRYLVLMPALGRVGVSRKIEDDEDRRRLRDILLELNPPKGAGLHRPHRRHRPHQERALARPGLSAAAVEGDRPPHQEDDRPGGHLRRKRHDHPHDPRHLHRRRRRDLHRRAEGLRAGQGVFAARHAAVRQPAASSTKAASRCSTSTSSTTEIAQIYQRKVPLSGGGSIVIDQTEALVAIDVNSGNFRTDDDAEETAYQLNQIAAKEIARQLRLRDLGGVIVNDFIDMRQGAPPPRRRARAPRRHAPRPRPHQDPPHQPLRPDRDDAAADSPQPQAERLQRLPLLHRPRPRENGREHGDRSRPQAAHGDQRQTVARVTVTVEEEVATYLNNKKRRDLMQLEAGPQCRGPGGQQRGPFAGVFEDRLPEPERPRSADCRRLKNAINWGTSRIRLLAEQRTGVRVRPRTGEPEALRRSTPMFGIGTEELIVLALIAAIALRRRLPSAIQRCETQSHD